MQSLHCATNDYCATVNWTWTGSNRNTHPRGRIFISSSAYPASPSERVNVIEEVIIANEYLECINTKIKSQNKKNASADANRPSTAYQTKRYTVQNVQKD